MHAANVQMNRSRCAEIERQPKLKYKNNLDNCERTGGVDGGVCFGLL